MSGILRVSLFYKKLKTAVKYVIQNMKWRYVYV